MKIVDVFKYKVIKMLLEQAEKSNEHFNALDDDNYKTFGDTQYKTFENARVMIPLSNVIKVHKLAEPDTIAYGTLDHENKKCLHFSYIQNRQPTKFLPFPHQEQDNVAKVPNSKLVGKNFVTNLLIGHIKLSGYPLISSKLQLPGGLGLWRNLSKKALDEGLNVYHHDHGKITKLNHSTLQWGLDNYTTEEGNHSGRSKNLIISKTPLNET